MNLDNRLLGEEGIFTGGESLEMVRAVDTKLI
jgi:hypothetical protein